MDLGKDSFGVDVATVDMFLYDTFATGLGTDDGCVFAIGVEAKILCCFVL